MNLYIEPYIDAETLFYRLYEEKLSKERMHFTQKYKRVEYICCLFNLRKRILFDLMAEFKLKICYSSRSSLF